MSEKHILQQRSCAANPKTFNQNLTERTETKPNSHHVKYDGRVCSFSLHQFLKLKNIVFYFYLKLLHHFVLTYAVKSQIDVISVRAYK